MNTIDTPKLSLRQRSKLLSKAARTVLKADKELVAFPVLQSVVGTILLVCLAAIVFFTGTATGSLGSSEGFSWHAHSIIAPVSFAIMYIGMTFIAHYFEAAVYAGAMQRFKGEDPTIESSLRQVNKKIRPLILFSLLIATVGLILGAIEDKVPLAGKIAIWLFGAAWSVANVFSIPTIITSEENIKPLEATKNSVALIKKVWGESVALQLSVAFFGLSWILLALLMSAAAGGLAGMLISPVAGGVLGGVLLVIGISIITTITMTLVTIVKAAVFYYATTGEAPEHFAKDLLHNTFTLKKSKKLFSN